MNTKLQMAFFILTLVIALVGITWASITESRLKRFFMGKKAKDLEDVILSLKEEIKNLQKEKELMRKEIAVLNEKIKKTIRGVETIRFNPFSDQGGNQSFAIGMLNEEGSGLVLSSLYARDRMSVFAKPIKNNKSEYELSNEEKEVLSRAQIKEK